MDQPMCVWTKIVCDIVWVKVSAGEILIDTQNVNFAVFSVCFSVKPNFKSCVCVVSN